MNSSQRCAQCGEPLPSDAPEGNCPTCLVRLALIGAAEAQASPAAQSSTIHLQPSTKVRWFGDYELLEEIAHGGMGVVFKARQLSLNRTVAVKMLLSGQFAGADFLRRFRQEAEAAANLQHPHIVAIHEVGEHEGQQYFSMDFVDGPNLAQLVRDQPLPPKRAASLLETIAEAVHYAHQRGIIHRDLKPSNILLDTHGQPHVTDFGLAKLLPNSELETQKSELTLTGQVLGTPGYMSPEQAGGDHRAVTSASDVYSLGAVLYFLVTNRAPFAADSVGKTLQQIHEREPVSPRLLNPAVPRDLETICLKCLSKEPSQRYAAAQALADELNRFLAGEPIRARPVALVEKLWRWCRRKPAFAAFILALLLVGAAGLAGILLEWRRAERHVLSETALRLRAEELVTMLELQRVEDLFDKDEVTMAMAYLARMVRQQPTNQIATRRLLAALTQRNFALPVGEPLRHTQRVYGAEFCPDGQRVLTASLDMHAAVWDAHDGKMLFRLPHPREVRIAHFTPDGSRIVTVADDFHARLWDAATGSPLGQPMAHAKSIYTAQFSPDGQRLLTASADGSARLWSGRTGEPLLEPLRHQGPVNSARFSADGTRIVTASADKTAQVWDAFTSLPQGPALQHTNGVISADFGLDGKSVVTALDEPDPSLCLWDLPSGEKRVKSFTAWGRANVARFSPEGQRVLAAADDGTAQLWNVRDWAALAKPMHHRASIRTAEFSVDGQRILTGSTDNTARLWDAQSGDPLTAPLGHDDLVFSARFSPDGMFAVTASADHTARIWDVRPGGIRSQLLPALARWRFAVFSPDGETIGSLGEADTVGLWSARTAQPGPKLAGAHGFRLIHLRWSPDGQRVAGFYGDRTWIWDTRTGNQLIEPIRPGADIVDVKFSPDGHWLATAGRDGKIHQWNTRTCQPRGEPIPNRDKVEFFAYSPDGQRLLCTDFKNDQARLHDAASGRLLAQTPERDGRIMHGDFSADGQLLVTASEDATARIWRANTLEPVGQPLRHRSSVLWVRFNRDRGRIVTASDDGTARVWDVQTGQPVGEPLTHRAHVVRAEFSPDNLLVMTASRDSTARLWDATTGRPVAEPFVHRGELVSARFSPDGRRVLTVSHSDGARVWDVPPAPSSETRNPKAGIRNGQLLADLAEAIIGKRVDPQGALENVSSAGLAQVRREVADLPRDDFSRWLEWFFADRGTRTISPYSQIIMP